MATCEEQLGLPLQRPISNAIALVVFGLVTVFLGSAYAYTQLITLRPASTGETVFTMLFVASLAGFFCWLGVAALRGGLALLFGRSEVIFQKDNIQLFFSGNVLDIKTTHAELCNTSQAAVLQLDYQLGDRWRDVGVCLPAGREHATRERIVQLTGLVVHDFEP